MMNNCKDEALEEYICAQHAFHEWEKCCDAVHCDCGGDTPIPPTPKVIYSSVTTTITSCTADYTKITLTTTSKYSGYTLDNLQLYSTDTQTTYQDNCVECGYVPPTPIEPIYDVLTTISYFCEGYNKMKKIHTDYLSGYSLTTMEVYDTVENVELFETNSRDCGYEPQPQIIFSSTTEEVDLCRGYDWFNDVITHYYSGYSEDSLVEYLTNTEPELLEANSEHCGYIPPQPEPDICETTFIYRDGYTETKEINGKIEQGDIPYHEVYVLSGVNIGNCVTWIGNNCFGSHASSAALTYITIPNSVTYIDNAAFQGTSINYIKLPSGITTVNYATFKDSSLRTITFNEKLMYIKEYAFSNTSLRELVFPSSLLEIADYACENNTLLESISLPKGLRKIGVWAFVNCGNLYKVIYNGTISEWNRIDIHFSAFDGTKVKKIICTDGEVEIN